MKQLLMTFIFMTSFLALLWLALWIKAKRGGSRDMQISGCCSGQDEDQCACASMSKEECEHKQECHSTASN